MPQTMRSMAINLKTRLRRQGRLMNPGNPASLTGTTSQVERWTGNGRILSEN
jgi:hypothetical protein